MNDLYNKHDIMFSDDIDKRLSELTKEYDIINEKIILLECIKKAIGFSNNPKSVLSYISNEIISMNVNYASSNLIEPENIICTDNTIIITTLKFKITLTFRENTVIVDIQE